jgi:putative flippase GtrA
MLAHRQRQLLFICVGATCFLTQYSALTAMSAVGVNRPLANALGFVISAQLNFALSTKLTWRDRPAGAARTLWARLLSYNATALVSLGVNTAVFTLTYHELGNLGGAALGVICGMCVTYLVCDLLIFRDRRRQGRAPSHAAPRRAAYARTARRVWLEPAPVFRPGQGGTGRHRAATAWDQT